MKAELDRTASESFKAYIENRWYNIKYMWAGTVPVGHPFQPMEHYKQVWVSQREAPVNPEHERHNSFHH